MTSAPLRRLSPFLWAGRTVGLLGGSFNPAHAGHVHISRTAFAALGLDAVWWLVSPQNPLKSRRGMAPYVARLAQARAVAAAHPQILVSDFEHRHDLRFTADTLAALRARFPSTRFVWLMGLDNAQNIHHWRRWEDIFLHTPVAVMDRPPRSRALRHFPAHGRFAAALRRPDAARGVTQGPPPAWVVLRAPTRDISSTRLRQRRASAKIRRR